jgi:hypothetical protein
MKLSNNANEVLIGSGWEGNVWTRAAVGRSFPEFWGYIVDGIFQTQAEADAYPKAIGATGTYNKPGHFKFRDINGDKVINTSDMTWIGSPHPKLTGGLNIDLGYKNFDLNIFLYGSYGNKTSWASSKFTDFSYTSGNRSKNRLYNSWGSPYLNDNADAILPIADLATESMLSSSFFIKDGSFLRLQNLQLGYNLPGKVLSKLKLSNLNIYVQLVNLFTFTKYPGLDPELNITGIQMGIDEDDWPHARQIMFGVSLKL